MTAFNNDFSSRISIATGIVEEIEQAVVQELRVGADKGKARRNVEPYAMTFERPPGIVGCTGNRFFKVGRFDIELQRARFNAGGLGDAELGVKLDDMLVENEAA